MARERNRRRSLLWALLGGAILLAGLVALFAIPFMNSPEQTPATTAPSTSNGTHEPSPTNPPDTEDTVDESVAEVGWTPEPITIEPELYIRRALEAASTFDTQLSTREDWLTFLDTWFTPDIRYSSPAEQQDAMAAAQLELRQSVVLPASDWDALAQEDGRVSASANDEIDYVDVPENPTGTMRIGTTEVTLTFTSIDGSGNEVTYDETVRVSVQVLCGEGSVPTPDSAQRAGDCKIIRYFSEPMEP